MAQYVLVNDLHLSDRAPRSCTDSYNDDLFDLLTEVNRLATQRQAAGIIYAGDIFHFKTPGRTSHATVMRLIQTAQAAPCPVYAVAGNHDLSHDRLDSLTESQPLGVVFACGAIRELNGWLDPIALDEDCTFVHPVYGVPWLGTWDDSNVHEALAAFRELADEHQPALVVTHAPLYPPGKELKYEFYPAAKFADAMGNHGTVHYGHVHEPHGVFEVDGVTFSNPGALSRGSLHEHNLTRAVQVACWDSHTDRIEHLTLPHKPPEQVFRLDEANQARTATQRLDQFLSQVGTTRLEVTTTEAVLDHIRSLGLDASLQAVVEELLAGAA